MPISAVAGWTRRNWPTPLVTPRIRIAGTEVPCWAGMAGREHHAMRQTQSSLHDAMQERCLPQQRLRPSSGKTPPVLGPSSSPRTCISQRLMRRHRVPLTIAGSSHLAPIAPTAQQRVRIRFGALGRGAAKTAMIPHAPPESRHGGSRTVLQLTLQCPHVRICILTGAPSRPSVPRSTLIRTYICANHSDYTHWSLMVAHWDDHMSSSLSVDNLSS